MLETPLSQKNNFPISLKLTALWHLKLVLKFSSWRGWFQVSRVGADMSVLRDIHIAKNKILPGKHRKIHETTIFLGNWIADFSGKVDGN